MVKIHVYIEGGGDGNSGLIVACQKGFREFLANAQINVGKVKLIPCGNRGRALKNFRLALKNGLIALLLVDSEGPVHANHQSGDSETWRPWSHLESRPDDGWKLPEGATEQDCHLMVQCTESWLIADRAALRHFFGQHFKAARLPAPTAKIESIPAEAIIKSLKLATSECETKRPYDKGAHSFELLSRIDPAKVKAASPWAARFLAELKSRAP